MTFATVGVEPNPGGCRCGADGLFEILLGPSPLVEERACVDHLGAVVALLIAGPRYEPGRPLLVRPVDLTEPRLVAV